MTGAQQKPHAIMIPYPYQGHINPFVHLAVKLASQGFTITFVNTQSVDRRISMAQSAAGCEDAADIFAGARDSGLDIRYATVSDGFPIGFDRSLNHDRFVEGLIHDFSDYVGELVARLAFSDPPVTCLIADTFYVWASAVAGKHNLVTVSFWTEPALVLSLYYHLDLLKTNGHFGAKEVRRSMKHGVAYLEAVPVPGTPRGWGREGDDLDSSQNVSTLVDSVKELGTTLTVSWQRIGDGRFVELSRSTPSFSHRLIVYLSFLCIRLFSSPNSEGKREDVIDYIPGVGTIKPTDLTSYLQADDIQTVVHRVIYRAFEDVKKADIIICNTVQELEFDTLSALQKKQPIYAIGPIVSGFTNQTVTTSLWTESDCTSWLNGKPNGSVLYVSFGSHAHTTSKEDIWEIAHGLVTSGVNFLWVVRPDIVNPGETNFLPPGFECRIRGRGLIVRWCSQIKVISHRAIGGFLSHCGWNSVLESISCKVPLICFPLFTDQFTNRKLVVSDWKIGINLCDGSSITREEVEEKIKFVMSEETSKELREAIKEVSKKMENALTSDGSSERNFKQFIENIKAQISKKAGPAFELPDQSTELVWASTAVNLCRQTI
ncbi:hypothetical protein OROGR_017633 [Orobanche gracilis]